MPPAQLKLTQELEKQIATAEKMHNFILVTSPSSIKMDTDSVRRASSLVQTRHC
jgi:hypothetical protein